LPPREDPCRAPATFFVFVAAAAAALAIAPPAAAGRTIRLKVPRFVVPPHTDREVCTFVVCR